ncbi:MAG: glycerophosphodiester phosphodiesterase family protein [Saccharofermentanales bacterium]
MLYLFIGIFLFLAVNFIGYFILIRPAKADKSRMKRLAGWDYAHRGLYDNRNKVYENTMEAFGRAIKMGYGIELDIQLTKDGRLVVFHDFNLFRMCGVDKRVDELTYDQILALPINKSDARIPLFRDVLELVAGRTPLIVEIKTDRRCSEICIKANETLDGYKGAYCIESFNAFIVYWYKLNRPDIIRGQLSMNFAGEKIREDKWQRFLLTFLLLNFIQKPDFIAYRHTDSRNPSLRICKRLYKTFCVGWTITSQVEYNKAVHFFDVIIFEGFFPVDPRLM